MTDDADQPSEAYDWSRTRGEKWRAQLSGMEAMLAPVDEPLLKALRLEGPLRIADVGCGGGGTTREILRRAPAGSVVHGFDISPALVEAARARAAGQSVTFEVADAAKAAPARPFDRLASRFGVMFFDDPKAAFTNLAGWLAPRGRVAFAVWGRPAENPWMTIGRDAVAEVVDVPRPEPDAPGPFRYGDPTPLLGLLRAAGLVELDVHDWRGALPVGGGLSAEEAAAFALASFASFGELLAKAGPTALERVRQSLTDRFTGAQRNGAVWLDARVHVVTGARG